VRAEARARAIASMMTTGNPSAKLGSTKAQLSSRVRRMVALSAQPRRCTFFSGLLRAMAASSSRRKNPSPMITSSAARPSLSLARGSIPNLRLLIFGHPQSPGLPLPPGAVFLGNPTAEQIRATYSQCDVWLFGAREEGFELPILEAMACRTPVIGTPAGAALELLVDGAGILVPREDPDAMARAIVEVCQMENAA